MNILLLSQRAALAFDDVQNLTRQPLFDRDASLGIARLQHPPHRKVHALFLRQGDGLRDVFPALSVGYYADERGCAVDCGAEEGERGGAGGGVEVEEEAFDAAFGGVAAAVAEEGGGYVAEERVFGGRDVEEDVRVEREGGSGDGCGLLCECG